MRRAQSVVTAFPLRLRLALTTLAGAIAFGTAGYLLLTDMSFVDALYQTVTTLSTVGFRELTPFDTKTKLFTMALILVGVGTVLYTLTLVMEQVLEGDLRSRFHARRIRMRISKLSDHYIICGFGRVGQEIALELSERKEPFVVIDQAPERSEQANSLGYLVLTGDASDETVLEEANIKGARCLLAALDSDSGNTYITLSAKALNPKCFVVARCSLPRNEGKLRFAGADRVLSLYSLGGRRMVLSALQPLAAEFMDNLAAGRHGELVLAEFEATPESGLAGVQIQEFLPEGTNATLLGIRRADGRIEVGPPSAAVLSEGDAMIVMADEEGISRLHGRRNGATAGG